MARIDFLVEDVQRWMKANPDEHSDCKPMTDEQFSEEQRQRGKLTWVTHPNHKPMLGKKHTKATKKRISETLSGRVVSDETKEKQRQASMGNTYGSANRGQVRKPDSEKYHTLYMRKYREKNRGKTV